MEYLSIFADAALVRNLALAYFLGMCMFLAVSNRVGTALGFGIAVFCVQVVTVPVNNLLERHLLRPGALAWAGHGDLDLSYLSLISFVGVIAAMVQIVEIVLDRFFPALHARLGVFLPLITVNCAILGGTLFMVQRKLEFGESVAYGAGSGFGWALAIVLLAAIREKLRYSEPPPALQGMGLTFIVAGLMSLAFLAFSGMRIEP
jgi:Na+-transporting NADH:ubiquinone oxidoreductase subunit E